MGKFKTALEYLNQDNRQPELKHSQDAERFLKEASECDASAAAIDARIRSFDYAVENGDAEAQQQAEQLEAEKDALKKAATRKRGAAAEARKLAALAQRKRQEKQYAERIEKLGEDNNTSLKGARRASKNIQEMARLIAKDAKDALNSRIAIRDAFPISWLDHSTKPSTDRFVQCVLYPDWVKAVMRAELANAFEAEGIGWLVPWPDENPGHREKCWHCGARARENTKFEHPSGFYKSGLVSRGGFKGLVAIFEASHALIKKCLSMASLDGEVMPPPEPVLESEPVEAPQSPPAKPREYLDEEIRQNELRGNPNNWPLSGREWLKGEEWAKANTPQTIAAEDLFGE